MVCSVLVHYVAIISEDLYKSSNPVIIITIICFEHNDPTNWNYFWIIYNLGLAFIDHQEDTLNLALVQYCFDKKEHKVNPRPHANSKRSESYVRTMPSTLKKLKHVTQNLTAKFAVSKCTSTNSLLTASSAGAIPCNRQKAADMRRRRDETETALHGKKGIHCFRLC